MSSIRWTPFAIQDLEDISSYIEQRRDLQTANRICRKIYDTVQILRRFPESGKAGLEEDTREFAVPTLPYIVIYRVRNDEVVQIVRIWHGARQRG